jgi:hypothetical protein
MGVDLAKLLAGKQRLLLGELETGREIWEHPGSRGDTTEIDWRGPIAEFLPKRYAVTRAFVLDSNGDRSEQIDLVVHDAHFCPLLFEQGDDRFIPAESVYAVFEIKQELTRDHMLYAAEKVASVRRLSRTNQPIVHAGGEYAPRELFQIIGGILAYQSSWSPPFGDPLKEALKDGDADGRLDLGCAAIHGGFATSWEGNEPTISTSEPASSLMFFLLRLFAELQRRGSVPAIDLAAYAQPLESDS